MLNEDLSRLSTEGRNPKSLNIDTMSALEIATLMNEEDAKVALAISNELVNIARVIEEGAKAIANGGRLIYMGAGTSGRLGVLDASECPPTYGVSPDCVIGLMAGGRDAMFAAKEGAEDDRELGALDLKGIKLNKNDVVVGLAASGRTPYVLGGMEYAMSIGCFTAGICCSMDSALSKCVHVCIAPIVGAEVVTGSTRLKSGTAQKMVLNMLSTGIMIKLNKVYSNLMVDLRATNQKLVKRAIGIIIQATNCTQEVASNALIDAGNNAKLAILMIKTNLDANEAKNLLQKTQGSLAKAIASTV